MKLGPVTKLDNKNKTTFKIFGGDTMPANCGVTVILPINGQFGAIQTHAQSAKRTFSLKAIFYLAKTENRTKKSLTQLSLYCFE